MLDSNTFDYIYNNNGLTNKVQNAVDNGKLQLFATDIQKQEIEKITNDTRKQAIRQTAEKIRVRFIETSGAVVALDQSGQKGYDGSRVGSGIASDEDIQLLENLTRVNMKHPLKNKGDLLTLYTAIKKNMDYLVTNDKDFEKSLNAFKMEGDTKLQIRDYEGFEELL